MSLKEQSKLLGALFPHKCPFCGRVIGGAEDGVCPECAASVSRCVRPAAEKGVYYGKAYAVYEYKGRVRSALLGYKFSGKRALGRFFGIKIAELLKTEGLNADVIVCPPSLSKRERGSDYDHAQLLAKMVSRYSGIRFKNVLKRTGKRRPMYELSPAERRANIADSVRVADAGAVRGKTVLIVDDILTTGATANECARMLRGCGAVKIYVAAAAARK